MVNKNNIIIAFVSSVILFLGIICLINIIVDPFGMFRLMEVPGFNIHKPALYINSSRAKIHAINVIKPQSIILGTSRTEIGIDPDSKNWTGAVGDRYNLSLISGSIRDALYYMKYAHSKKPLKNVLLGVDFMMFKTDVNSDIALKRTLKYAVNHPQALDYNKYKNISSLFSLDMLKASLDTVLYQKMIKISKFKYNGVRSTYKLEKRKKKVGHRRLFLGNEKRFIFQRKYYVKNTRDYLFYSKKNISPGLLAFENLVKFCIEKNIQLSIFITPIHARQLELIKGEGLWGEFENWKKYLVNIIEKYALNEKTPLWDFSGYNSVTTETVPSHENKVDAMKWYWESSHFTQAAGELILKRIFSKKPLHNIPPDFGYKLTSKNIDAYLIKMHELGNEYLSVHGQSLVEIKKLFMKRRRKIEYDNN